ncbi:MAG: hypothetical protein OEN02_04990 [Gammaproteobacteria bacterium]|nr:hypothetical protein [Gammaproteobacteria bacterium]MDH3535689.1 hypothetical protein [Gammaproteobacteria bacterium]
MLYIRLRDIKPVSSRLALSLVLMSLLSGCSVFGAHSVEEAVEWREVS